MPFNVEQHANLGYIDRDVKALVDEMRAAPGHDRMLKGELEHIIREAYKVFKKRQLINK